VEVFANLISNTGKSYSVFSFDNTNSIRIQKNSFDGTDTIITDLTDIDNDYIVTGLIDNFIYISYFGGFDKINTTTGLIEWSTSFSPMGEVKDFMLLTNGNIGVGVDESVMNINYSLYEFNVSTGTQVLLENIQDISGAGFIKYLNNYRLTFNRNWSNYGGGVFLTIRNLIDNSFYETDWKIWYHPYFPYGNCWGRNVDEINIIGDRVIGLNESENDEYVMFYDKQMTHGYLQKIVEDTSHGIAKSRKINDDGTFTFVTVQGTNTLILHVTIPEEDMSLLPSLNVVTDDHIVAVYDSQKYVDGQFVPAYHESTIVFENGYLPIVEYNEPHTYPENSWLTIVYRVVYVNNADSSHKINIKVHCVEEITVGISENKKEDFSIYPNPTRNTITIKSAQNIASTKVYNKIGQLLLVSTNSKNIDLSKLNNGLYILKIENESGSIFSRKIIKE